MNQRNVLALTDLIKRVDDGEMSANALAEKLAAEGVLVPSALTDEEIESMQWRVCPAELSDDSFVPCEPDRWRGELERVARGDA